MITQRWVKLFHGSEHELFPRIFLSCFQKFMFAGFVLSCFQDFFLGHALQDPQPAIIHHFAFHEDTSKFSFPDFSAGWAISSGLLKR